MRLSPDSIRARVGCWLVFLALLVVFVGSAHAGTFSIPSGRSINWQVHTNVGVPGGIPSVTTQCATSACRHFCGWIGEHFYDKCRS